MDRFKSSSEIKKNLSDATEVIVDASTVRQRLTEAWLNGRPFAKKNLFWANDCGNRGMYEWKNMKIGRWNCGRP